MVCDNTKLDNGDLLMIHAVFPSDPSVTSHGTLLHDLERLHVLLLVQQLWVLLCNNHYFAQVDRGLADTLRGVVNHPF